MRLHRLVMTAFGPYRGTVRVDFDELSADGLFLLHGETGAGKTTLLDGVAYALFGQVPGARGEVRRLRCDHAADSVATRVEVELTIQGHRLRIVRSPEFQRAKKRGVGTTTVQAKASLGWIGDVPDGYPPDGFSRIDEVARTVSRLLGMTHTQFFQVVLLPQGEFAQFLRAETEDREKLLEQLFGTARFAETERWFRDRRTARHQEVQAARRGVEQLVTRIAQAMGTEPPPDEQPVAAWVDTLRARAADERTDAAEAEHLAARRRRDADSAAVDGERRAAAAGRRRELLRRLDELDARQDERAGWATELADARRAAPVAAEERERSRAENDLHVRRRHVAAALDEACAIAGDDTSLRTLLDAVGLADATSAASPGTSRPGADVDTVGERSGGRDATTNLRAYAAARREEAGALAGLVEEAEHQEPDRQRLAEVASDREQAEKVLAELERRGETLPVEAHHARHALDASVAASAALGGLRTRHDELTRLCAAARELPEAERRLADARQARQDAVDAHQSARERLLDLRGRRLAGMAAELAGALVPDRPCTVCGSRDHPAPAVYTSPVTEAEEQTAVDAEHRTALARETAAAEAQTAQLARDALHDQLAGRDEAELAAALDSAAAELSTAEGLAAREAERADLLRRLEQESAELHRDRLAVEGELATARSTVEHLEHRIAERERRLSAASDGFPDVAARRRALLSIAEAVDELAERTAAVTGAEERLLDRRVRLDTAVAAAGFGGIAEAMAAARDEAVLNRLDEALRNAERQEAALRAELADPLIIEMENSEAPDVAALTAEAEAARRAAEEAVARLRAAEATDEELAALTARWARAAREIAPVEADFATLAALTDVVNGKGQNSRKMSLRSYVLAARLEEVAVTASRRLQRMSQGRYSFVHSDAAGARGKRGGLGLDVVDDYSGRARSAKTLSGGESFLASLALALGLADVVAAETGGALLDTLFVDEGFGSLDPETLDLVMDTLDDLRAGGRVVGLVSHVDELRQRIPTRLRVRRSRSGSTLEMETA
ncbi:exonuclease SbcC [Actinoalloteichus hoggarensis]|uniref:Nuclease SbcCD subunit C n=1 Tax=Actinoalloteichus hoggarensis TaxID=1470176 RepID=A0A221VY83_9PSEU|nr:SMC family ATPase [Actinoalloteichus hoggarensis]ASO18457.1 Nuclease SbcCD subunit C [Actinoalloteichus hoggarensis]MBB5921824.1 exonuclease SbcC [Actinoalloteichus hoggarensis]